MNTNTNFKFGTTTIVNTTYNYEMFKPIDGNRNKNLLHINRLKKSMQSNYLFTVIVVNENYEIIDGQHRFHVIQELKLPLNYVVIKGYGINEVHILNQNAKVWTSDDYLEGYCNLGYTDYVVFRAFKNKYNLKVNETMVLLSSDSSIQNFNAGNFKIKDIQKSTEIIEKILLLEAFYKGVRRRTFIFAMNRLLKNQNFDFNDFVHKLKQQPSALVDCVSTDSYVQLIEEIYNYKRREKINLRY